MKVESLRPTRDLKPETNLGPERLGSCFLDAAGAPQGAGDIEHVAEHLGMDLRPLDVSPAHGDLGSLQHALEIVLLVGAVASPDKARHDFRHHAATKEIAPGPDCAAGVQKDADTQLHVVTDQSPELRQPGVELPVLQLDPDGTVGIFQIAGGGHGSDVDPLAEIAVPDEAVMVLVRVGMED